MKPHGYLAALTSAILVFISVPVHAQTDAAFFEPSVVHDVFLRMNSRDLDTLRATFTANTYYPADLQVGTTTVRNVAVRSRGNGSRNGVKPGLRVDLNYFVSDQAFAGQTAFVLDNMAQDASMIREQAAMALYARMGQPAPRLSYARLFINNEYQGVYQLIEEPNERFVDSRFPDDNGYLFEYHWRAPYYMDDLGDDLGTYEALFEPRTHEHGAPEVLFGPIRDLLRVDPGEDLVGWRTRVASSLDLEQLVSSAAIEIFESELDGLTGYDGTNNFYLYRRADDGRHVIVPWDRDNAFQQADSSIYQRVNENRLLRQALAFSDLHALFLNQLEACARFSAEDGWLEQVVANAAALIEAPSRADSRKPYSDEQHAADVEVLLAFARQRSASVLEQVAQARRTIR